MRIVGLAGIALGIAVLVGATMFARWAGLSGGLPRIAGDLFINAGPVDKLGIMVLALTTVVATIMAAISIASGGRSEVSEALGPLSLIAPLFGAVVAAYGYWFIHVAADATHTTNLMIMAPSIAEDTLALGLGLLAGGVAALPRRGRT